MSQWAAPASLGGHRPVHQTRTRSALRPLAPTRYCYCHYRTAGGWCLLRIRIRRMFPPGLLLPFDPPSCGTAPCSCGCSCAWWGAARRDRSVGPPSLRFGWLPSFLGYLTYDRSAALTNFLCSLSSSMGRSQGGAEIRYRRCLHQPYALKKNDTCCVKHENKFSEIVESLNEGQTANCQKLLHNFTTRMVSA